MATWLIRRLLPLALVAAVFFGAAFALARAARDDGETAPKVTPVYYGPPPSVPNLDRANTFPKRPDGTPAR
jgi:hypothetical protein